MTSIAEFDGLAEIDAAWRRGLEPEPALTVWQWADKHRRLSGKAAAEPGPWRTSRTPFLREIMDALSPSNPAHTVVFMKGSQIGASESGNNWIGYMIHHAPGPMLAVQPTAEMAKRFSQQRIATLIEESPELRRLVKPARARDSGNTVFSKEFPGGILVLAGANSEVGLRSMPARYLFLDEIDAYPAALDDNGDPISLAIARTSSFQWRRKIYMASTPTVRGMSRIELEFERSDKRRYFVPCPHCGHMQPLEFPRLKWSSGHPETAAYECAECGALIDEHHKTQMLERGEWRSTAESVETGFVGFHLSSLYSPVGWLSWSDIARQFVAAEKQPEQLRAFVNTVLGETWFESGDAPEWERLYERREHWDADVPDRACLITAGADVQKNRIEVFFWAWGPGFESWLIEHEVIDHGPGEEAAWREMDAQISRTFVREDGGVMAVAKFAIDAGHEETAVYAWCRRSRAMAVKGVEGINRIFPVTRPKLMDSKSDGELIKCGAKVWAVSTHTFKSEFYRQLRLNRLAEDEIEDDQEFPPGYVHIPGWASAEIVKQMVSEHLVSARNRYGYAKPEWRSLRPRNEALDCRVYARAALWEIGADRYGDRFWNKLRGVVDNAKKVSAPVPAMENATTQQQRRGSGDWLGVGSGDWF